MIKALSHLVITSKNVTNISNFFTDVFGVKAHFANEDFADFVLPDKSRVAFFRPVGKAAKFFELVENPAQVSYGVTVENVDDFYKKLMVLSSHYQFEVSGEPKDHPWGEKSFLLMDPDGNRWEITQSPSDDGHLVNIS
ncbi:VOC family protein [Halobacteriovorax sp. ZH4_bin.1]|uniref:VOC family protein n=1 Tax=unclassified Halobacteriovorax TaxID=2639665 RepID=UPI003710E234